MDTTLAGPWSQYLGAWKCPGIRRIAAVCKSMDWGWFFHLSEGKVSLGEPAKHLASGCHPQCTLAIQAARERRRWETESVSFHSHGLVLEVRLWYDFCQKQSARFTSVFAWEHSAACVFANPRCADALPCQAAFVSTAYLLVERSSALLRWQGEP